MDRQVLIDQMGCQVFDEYNSAERVSLIQTCEYGNYHIASDYGFTELLPVDGGRYELVGTGFNNLLMPLIRYRLGDLVELDSGKERCQCGRQFPCVKSVIGRMDDYVRTPDGRHVGRLSQVFKGVRNVAMGQIVQDSLKCVTIRIVPYAGFDEDTKRQVFNQACERLGTDIDIKVELVSDIPRSANGKFKLVVSKLDKVAE
jgi:phenylacetate-CoA ligase